MNKGKGSPGTAALTAEENDDATGIRAIARRRYRTRVATADDGKKAASKLVTLSQLDPERVPRVEEVIRKKVEEAMASEDVQKRIEVRLKAERARLEEAVTRQLEQERQALLERKRKEQEERRRQQEELERILAENARKLQEAQMRALVEKEEGDKEKNDGLQAYADQKRSVVRTKGLIVVDGL